MLNAKLLDRIRRLNLHVSIEEMVVKIIEDAVAEAVSPGGQLVTPAGFSLIAGDWPSGFREIFWQAYPRRTKKDTAMKALDKIAKARKTSWSDLINGVERYKLSRDVQRGYVMHPATWLNGGCWKDEEPKTPTQVERKGAVSFFDGLEI